MQLTMARILIIGSDDDTFAQVREILSQDDYELLRAAQVEDAERITTAAGVDLVLADLDNTEVAWSALRRRLAELVDPFPMPFVFHPKEMTFPPGLTIRATSFLHLDQYPALVTFAVNCPLPKLL